MGLFSRSKNTNKAEEATFQPAVSLSNQAYQPQTRIRGVGLDNPVPVYNNNNNNNSRKPAVQDVAGVIGYSCAQRDFDFSYILALCDYISLSANESAKAAKALRKELKYATPDAQERACRLVGIMCKNSDVRFKQEIASKKFLGVLSDLATGKKTEPKVVTMILRVLSPLAFEYQYDRDLLLHITTLYNKLKSSDDPINGLPLAEDDTLFTPTTVLPRSSRQQYQTEMPSREEQLKWLQRKANEAKGNASMLTEALAFAENGDLEGNELVSEFYAKCFASQETITSNLDWCSVEAERSRSSIPAPISAPANELPPLDALSISSTPPTTTQYKSHNPFAPIIEASIPSPRTPTSVTPVVKPAQQEPTEEEMTYSMLLSSHSDIIEALHLHSTILTTSKEAIELKKIQERSKEEIRTDSNGNWLELSPPTSPITPTEIAGGSGSYANGTTSNNRQSLSSTNPYAKYQAPSSPTPVSQTSYSNAPNQGGGYMMDEQLQPLNSGDDDGTIWLPLTPTKPSLLPTIQSNNLVSSSSLATVAAEVDGYSDEPSALEVQEEEDRRRLGPSDKALGKLRKVSVREDANGVDQQAALEEALRAKYREE